jgi:hypothetical protein
MNARRLGLLLLLPLCVGGIAVAKGDLSWDDVTEADWIYSVVTRTSTLDGHAVHYPTPTAELAAALEARPEPDALRRLADARRELGDRAGAIAALQRWAEAEGPEAWAEVARWGNEYHEMGLAFRAAERALPGLSVESRRSLADERILWADAHPDATDPLALRQARAEAFPEDARALEEWVRALERAGRLDAAEAAFASSHALSPERRLLLRSDLQADHGNDLRAFEILDEAIGGDAPWSLPLAQAYAYRVDRGAPRAAESWRATLDGTFDAPALVRLTTYFEGQGRGEAAADLLRQIERRFEPTLDRRGWLLLERLHGELDSVPEAFRDALAAAQKGTPGERTDDLASLAHLALRAGGRPLAWGTYNDEPYRWVARVDRTPGFWTGGLSFLLTGQDWNDALARLESDSLAERTFATARALALELARRNEGHAALPPLRAAIMARHVERGEGALALKLLPVLEGASPDVAAEARRVALLAMRQVDVPLGEEMRLHRARLRAIAPDGTRPTTEAELPPRPDFGGHWTAGQPWRRLPPPTPAPTYGETLEEAIGRAEQRDRSHRASLDLLLGEMDRLPEAEALWADLSRRLEGWNLDDELGPRYERALARFKEPGIWQTAARWYARRSRHHDLDRLAAEIAARFRGADVFARLDGGAISLAVPEQPALGTRVRLVPWADWVRLKALQRFPHSRAVFREALGHLQGRHAWEQDLATRGVARLVKDKVHPVVVEDSLLEDRRAALLFVDADRREEWMAARMREGTLEGRLIEMEKAGRQTPVEDQLLLDGWSRLSHFERAAAPADRLAAAYPGDGTLAERVLSLHRSLAALDATHERAAHALVERTAPALTEAGSLWTALGEIEEDLGRPDVASPLWRRILSGDPKNADKVAELATLLWDYGHMAEGLAVVEEGRKQTGRPRFFAFEAGVLREETHDIASAVDEYLAALWPEEGDCFCSAFERDQRSLRRLSQLMGRERVRGLVEKRIASLRPGVKADEEALASLFPLATITPPEPGLPWDADDWIDAMDMPNDPVGRAERKAARDRARGGDESGTAHVGDVLLDKAFDMLPAATAAGFLDAASRWAEPLLEARRGRDASVAFTAAVLARRAALAPTEEDRIAREVERARYLLDHDRRADADALWTTLASRIQKLPDGAPRMHAEAERAGFLERSQGIGPAGAAWQALSARYPWSLGILEDHLSFLARHERGADGRVLLEAAIPRAAAGRREPLLERLTREALDARDLPQARRSVDTLLTGNLNESQRLGAIHLLARLSFKESASFDAMGLATRESAKLKQELHADLFHELARAADAEKARAPAVGLWIEALNRRLDRGWLGDAMRSADAAGQATSFLDFFERQRQRSPRDVRWAVAVREIKRRADDLDGAIAMAKTAVGVRPERESLWREAVDLMVRAGRLREAADYLEGWNAPRRADESVAGWRSSLYARADDGPRALAIERAALDAYAHEGAMDEDRTRELAARQARASRRLLEYGHPPLAWRLLAPDDAVARVTESALSEQEQAELALANSSFLRLLRARADDDDYRTAAGRVLAERGRPEQREEVLAWLLRQLFPAGAGGIGSDEALRRWWSFVAAADLERQLRSALAERVVARTVGPWQGAASAAFAESVGREVITEIPQADGKRALAFGDPALDGLWVRELVRSDRQSELGAFLEGRWSDLLARAQGLAPLPPGAEPLPWSSWLSDRAALEAWSRYAATRPEVVAATGRAFANRRSWDRFWALAAKRWDVSPLVAILPETERTAWFRFWEAPPGNAAQDPVLRARREVVEKASLAIGRLVAGSPGAVRDPIVAKLRGPRTLGDVLGADPRWLWPEFVPRKDAQGAVAETGDDRVVGQGKDAGRLPGSLWGERPGQAWFVLESLARFREGNADAALVPAESRERGRETERSLLAVRLALAEGNAPLALDLAEEHPGRNDDAGWRSAYLRLLTSLGRKERALEILEGEVRRAQPALTEEGLRAFETLALELDLGPALERLDAAKPIPPALLAYLRDRRGPDVAARFHTRDVPGFRAALASRWTARERDLSPEQVRFFLSDLWAPGAAPLPRQGLATRGGFWLHAADWLDRQRISERAEAILAIAALPDSARLDALAARGHETDDVVRLLQVRAALSRHEDDRALAWVDTMVQGLSQGDATYALASSPVTAEANPDAEEFLSTASREESPSEAVDPLTSRLIAWLRPFRDAKSTRAVEERFRTLLAERRAEGPVPLASWRLAFELGGSPEERKALLAQAEHAWIRGDWNPEGLGPLSEILAQWAPAEAPRWMARWTRRFDYEETAKRTLVLVRIQDPVGAARLLIDARSRGGWTRVEEVRGFDLWRGVADAATAAGIAAPPTWSAALPFWKGDAAAITEPLLPHLKAHPFDLLAARAALRTVVGGEEDPLRRAALSLGDSAMDTLGSSEPDQALLRLRIARGLLPRSWRAARAAFEAPSPEDLGIDLKRRRFRRAEIDGALADVARMAARAGDSGSTDAALAALGERGAADLVALRAETTAALHPSVPPQPFRMSDGKPAPYRPRDLDWRVLALVLNAGDHP